MTQTKKEKPEAEPLNEEAMKGVWVDGLGFHIGKDYIIFEGVITKPRTKKPYIISRIMFPSRVLEALVNGLTKALEEQRKRLAEEKKVKETKE